MLGSAFQPGFTATGPIAENGAERSIQFMPLSGEAIRMMNLVDDVATTMRRLLALVPLLAPEERRRVSEYLKHSEPSADQVHAALAESK